MKLITVTDRKLITDLREQTDVLLVYPLKSFCVGYPIEFEIQEIDGFILVNRILDDNDLDKLQNELLKTNAKGIIFDDLGIIELVKNLNIEKILLLNHLGTNVRSINYYLEYVDSVVISNDLTEEEIRYIVTNSNKKLVVNVFGLKELMYSRRLLLSNYANYYNIDNVRELDASILDKGFKIVENDYGTKFYSSKYYDGLSLLDLDNVLYFWYEPMFLKIEEIYRVLDGDTSNISTTPLFLQEKTYYKVGDE